MNNINKSLEALDKLFSKLSDEELGAIFNEIDSMDSVGPTISQYFENFENQFEAIFFDTPIVISHPISYLKNIKYLQNKEQFQSSFEIAFHKPMNCEITFFDVLQDNIECEILLAA